MHLLWQGWSFPCHSELPFSAFALDGRLLAKVAHKTSLSMILSGNHHKTIVFSVVSAPRTPLILGFPWLKLHNLHLDWSSGRIFAWSSHCHAVCLQSAFSPAGAARDTSPVPPDLSNVLDAYHDLSEVFNKEKALSLPLHRPYDCSIDLLPGAPLPTSRLYNLSKPEREAMQKYITESLAAGIIVPLHLELPPPLD